MTKKLVWLFEELPSPPHCALFALPTRPFSLAGLILAFFFEGCAFVLYYVAKQNRPNPFEWVIFGVFICSFAAFGFLILGLALVGIWTIRRLEIDLKEKQLSHSTLTPLRRSVQICPFDRIKSVRVMVESGSESPDPDNYTVELQMRDNTAISLGNAPEQEALMFARRMSELTSAPLDVVDLRK